MKSRFIALSLVIVLAFTLSACSEEAAMKPAEPYSATESVGENEVVIPQAVLNLTEEDDILLNGELKNGVYINRYFGYKLSVPEGWTLTRLNDDAAESTEIFPLRTAYEEEMNGLYFMAQPKSGSGFISVYVTALKDDERGLSEEELVKKDIDEMWAINKAFGDDDGPEYATAMLAGEEHPMSVQITKSGEGEYTYASFYIPKGDFAYEISLSGSNIKLEDLTRFFEKA